MSIADTIASITTNLSDAYDTLESKGATMPTNKNLENLSITIDSISGGGGSSDCEIPEFDGGQYGAVAYFDSDNNIAYYTASSSTDLTISSSNDSLPGFWILKKIDTDHIITSGNLLAYSFGSNITTLPNGFLRHCHIIKKIFGLENSNLTSIGNNFMSDCYGFNHPLILPTSLTTLGTSFLFRCSLFSNDIEIPPSVTSIGSSFLYYCNNNIGKIITHTDVSPTDTNSITTNSYDAPAYAHGVTLTGEGAATWATNLPNRTSSPYRRLIVGS